MSKISIEALNWALNHKHIRELTGNNDGPEIAEVQEYQGYLIAQYDKNGKLIKKGLPWCASFVSWCYKKGAEILKLPRPFPHCASIRKLVAHFKPLGKYYVISKTCLPRPGDIVLIINTKNPDKEHTGLCVKVEGNSIITIEGNKDNRVSYIRTPLKRFQAFIKV